MFFGILGATFFTTFDEATCKSLVGSEFPGKVEKIKTELYSYTIKDTGEVIILEHRYIYLSEDVEPEEQGKALELEEALFKSLNT